MSDLDNLDTAIQEAAVNGIASVTIGGHTVANKSLTELIEWRKQLIASQAATRPGHGLRFQQIKPVYR